MVMRVFALAAAVLIGTGSAAFALDQTRNTTPRSPTDLCCLGTPPLPIETSAASDSEAPIGLSQLAPMSDIKPGFDSANWSCRRPDGSQRCVSSLRNQ